MPHTKGFQRHMLRAQSASRNSAVPSLRSQSCEQLSVKTSQDSTMTQDGAGVAEMCLEASRCSMMYAVPNQDGGSQG